MEDEVLMVLRPPIVSHFYAEAGYGFWWIGAWLSVCCGDTETPSRTCHQANWCAHCRPGPSAQASALVTGQGRAGLHRRGERQQSTGVHLGRQRPKTLGTPGVFRVETSSERCTLHVMIPLQQTRLQHELCSRSILINMLHVLMHLTLPAASGMGTLVRPFYR